MKKWFAVLLTLVMILSMTACSNSTIPEFDADDYDVTGTCGKNVHWGFNKGTGELTIAGTGDMDNYHDEYSTPWHKLDVNCVSIESGVTSIGIYAFAHCDTLTELTISDSITYIGDHAFYDCSNLSEVTIPDSVTIIGDFAFCYCSGLNKVSIGDSVQTIGCDAFASCNNLTEVTIGNSVTTIGPRAFDNCTQLSKVKIPNSVTIIGAAAFHTCRSLTDVYFDGTEAQWNNIEINNYNGNLTEATIHFNS